MFTITWSNTALDQLADAYVAATPEERERLAAAIDSLNTRLSTEPLSVGESRVGGFRVEFVPRLAILFHVSEANQTVRVVRLRPSRR